MKKKNPQKGMFWKDVLVEENCEGTQVSPDSKTKQNQKVPSKGKKAEKQLSRGLILTQDTGEDN